MVEKRVDGGLSFLNEGLAVAFDPERATTGPLAVRRYASDDPRPFLARTARQAGDPLYAASGGSSLTSSPGSGADDGEAARDPDGTVLPVLRAVDADAAAFVEGAPPRLALPRRRRRARPLWR